MKEEDIEKVFKTFVGKIEQLPPMYSAIKVNGKKLYELARKGEEIKRDKRKVEIYSIEILKYIKDTNNNNKYKEIEFKVSCSKGTYIRTLCEDIASKLGTCGYMKSLRRIRVDRFTLEDINKIISIEEVLKKEQEYHLKNNELNKLLNGIKIKVKLKNGLVRIYNDKKFIGVGEIKDEILKRKIIL